MRSAADMQAGDATETVNRKPLSSASRRAVRDGHRPARLRTVEILPPNIVPTMIDATGSQVEEVNCDWCEVEGSAFNNGLWSRPILDVAIHAKRAYKATYPAEILDDSSSDLICESSTCE
jgi:hypothetical protein